jgi:hypothetical protein
MADTDRHDVVPETSGGARAPIVDDPPRRRHHRVATILGGTLTGFAIGAIAVLLIDRARYSGDATDPKTWIFGLPLLLAIGGTVVGAVIDGLRNVEDVDAPVRLRRFEREGRAATSVDGQTPGSAVPPVYEEDRPGEPHSRPPG